MLGTRFFSSMAFGVIALMVFAACGGSYVSRDTANEVVTATDAPVDIPTSEEIVDAVADDSSSSGDNLGVAFHASTVLPHGQLSDWVSYSDQYSVFTIVAEQQLPETEASIKYGYGTIGRLVTVRIEYTPWTSQSGPTIEGEFDTLAMGWTIRDGELLPNYIPRVERLEVGRRYMAPVILFEGDAWGFNTPLALRIEGDTVVAQTRIEGVRAPVVAQSLVGKTVDEVVELLADTKPDQRAVKYFHLPPTERWRAVNAEIATE